MKANLKISTLLSLVLLLTACIQTKNEITLNPDGKGKAVYSSRMSLDPPIDLSLGGGVNTTNADEMAKKEVAAILKESEGVDAWSDVSYQVDEGNILVFSGTVFFQSFNKLNIGGSFKSENNIIIEHSDNVIKVGWKKEQTPSGQAAVTPIKLSEQEVDTQVEQAQGDIQKTLAMLTGMLKGMKDEMVFHLPGKIDQINNFQQLDDQSAKLTIEGEKMLKAVETFANDTDAIRQMIQAGKNIQDAQPPEYFHKIVFGAVGEPVLQTSGDLETQFDYDQQVQEAQTNYAAMTDKLGISVTDN